MVGLALEVSETAKMKKQIKQQAASLSETDAKTAGKEIELTLEHTGVSPDVVDVFHYAFCYIGVLTGNS